MTALAHAVTAAMLTPFDASGTPIPDAAGNYAASLVQHGVGALAVLAHTGRGLHLSEDAKAAVIRTVRAAVEVPLIAGIGLSRQDTASPVAAERTLARAAEQMAASGADALLIYPVTREARSIAAGGCWPR